MFSAFSSTVHLHSKKLKRFSVDAFVLCCHKVFSSIAITLPVHQRDTLIICGIICWCVDSVASFLGCYDVEKRIDHSGKLLDLEKYVNVGFAEITSACHVHRQKSRTFCSRIHWSVEYVISQWDKNKMAARTSKTHEGRDKFHTKY